MRRTRFDDWPCPIARTTDLIGDWWTPLVMREAFSGRRRFEEFPSALDAPRAVLTARLNRLCEEPPVVLKDRETGETVAPLMIDEHTGQPLDIRRLRMGRNPAAAPAP